MSNDAVRTNLSYVLHEPSTSAAVTAQASRLTGARRSLDAAARRLARLTDAELAARTLVLAPLGEPPAGNSGTALSVQVGPWRMLRRVLAVRYGVADARPWSVTLVDDPGCLAVAGAEFFRGPARLCLPVVDDRSASWFAALALRPGGDRLLLELTPLAGDGAIERVLRAAEAAIRGHVGQWTCAAALWPRPAEDQLPEFRDA